MAGDTYATMGDPMVGLSKYFSFYNSERPHQSLGNETPDVVYRTAVNGGALIVDTRQDDRWRSLWTGRHCRRTTKASTTSR